MSEKCVCHINGYRVKDSVAREEIENAKVLINAHTNAIEEVQDTLSTTYNALNNHLNSVHSEEKERIKGVIKTLDTTTYYDLPNPEKYTGIYRYRLNVAFKHNSSLHNSRQWATFGVILPSGSSYLSAGIYLTTIEFYVYCDVLKGTVQFISPSFCIKQTSESGTPAVQMATNDSFLMEIYPKIMVKGYNVPSYGELCICYDIEYMEEGN